MSATIKTADELHAEIMNLQVDHEKSTDEFRDRRHAYIFGHRDARHQAAELVRASLAAEQAEGGKAPLTERLKMEAQIHAQEARTANATIAEIYRIVTEGTGEPGSWNGAEPVRKCIEDLRTRLAALTPEPAAYNCGAPNCCGKGIPTGVSHEGIQEMMCANEPAALPKCATCNDNGMIGGPSFYAPDEGGEPCPDCTPPAALPAEVSDLVSHLMEMAARVGDGHENHGRNADETVAARVKFHAAICSALMGRPYTTATPIAAQPAAAEPATAEDNAIYQAIAANYFASKSNHAPHGWLYDWTHSSALGKPDEHFTSFAKTEEEARRGAHNENVRPVYLAAPAQAAAVPEAVERDAAKIGRNDMMQFAEDAGFLPNTIQHWEPALRRYTDKVCAAIRLAAPEAAAIESIDRRAGQ